VSWADASDEDLRQIEHTVRRQCRTAFAEANKLHVEWGEIASEINRRKVAATQPSPEDLVKSMSVEDMQRLIAQLSAQQS